jgi:membrane associated rhomboid family serine protease
MAGKLTRGVPESKLVLWSWELGVGSFARRGLRLSPGALRLVVVSPRWRFVETPVTTVAPAWVAIPARSRRQAMDWSLALASQGIEVVIDHQPEGLGWVLLVSPDQQQWARDTIRQYRLENRAWRLRQRLRDWGFSFHWGALAWCWVLIVIHWVAEAAGSWLEVAGAMGHAVGQTGEWWRLITATTLHVDVGHLAANVSTGIVVLGLAMGRYGAGWALLATLLAGALGNLAGLAVHTAPYRGLGASGVVMGGLGLLAVQSFALWRDPFAAKRSLLTGVIAGMLLFVLFGLNPKSDVVAHTGGFVGGLVFGALLNLLPARFGRDTRADRLAGATAIVLTAVCWALALTGSP